MALTPLRALKDRDGRIFPVPVSAGYVDHRFFAAATAESHTSPTGANWVIATPTVDAYVNTGGTAVVPSADVTDGTGSTLCPAGVKTVFCVGADTTISVIATVAGSVQLEYYS